MMELKDFSRLSEDFSSENQNSRNGRWMFGRTITFILDLTVTSLMANVRTKEKVIHPLKTIPYRSILSSRSINLPIN